MELAISLGQMDVQLGQPEANLQKVHDLTAEAARRGSDILVLPELWSTGYDLENAARYATPTNTGIFAQVAALAQEYKLCIVGSCLSLLGEGQYGNTAVFFDPNGTALGQYSKVHLFRLMDEDHYLTAGDQLTLIEAEWGQAGLAICYDLRFPELFRAYAITNASLLFLPSEWPHPRLMHWRTLLRARAIENQMFMIACNRVGVSKNTHFFGHSCILDPWGEIVVEAGESELLLTAVIDTDQVHQVRSQIPVFSDRRPQVISNWLQS